MIEDWTLTLSNQEMAPASQIFYLKNKCGYVDRVEKDVSMNANINQVNRVLGDEPDE